MLRSHVIIEQNLWPRSNLRPIAGTGRLSITEQSSDDNEVLLGVECLVFSNEPFVVRDKPAIPGRIYDQRLGRVSKRLVRLSQRLDISCELSD